MRIPIRLKEKDHIVWFRVSFSHWRIFQWPNLLTIWWTSSKISTQWKQFLMGKMNVQNISICLTNGSSNDDIEYFSLFLLIQVWNNSLRIDRNIRLVCLLFDSFLFFVHIVKFRRDNEELDVKMGTGWNGKRTDGRRLFGHCEGKHFDIVDRSQPIEEEKSKQNVGFLLSKKTKSSSIVDRRNSTINRTKTKRIRRRRKSFRWRKNKIWRNEWKRSKSI